MKILQHGNTDIIGTRFNGQTLLHHLRAKGHSIEHCVWNKAGDDPDTWQLFNSPLAILINRWFEKLDKRLSLQSILPPAPLALLFKKGFRKADVVHYHLIHTGYFSFLLLPILTWFKKSVWTLHDPWAMTGHCVYPLDCTKWLTGCGACPRKDIYVPMRHDRSALMWTLKKFIYSKTNVEVIVASKWMEDMVKRSPLTAHFKTHLIPFGLDLTVFKPKDMSAARKQLGIPKDDLVIAFRSAPDWVKGVDHIMSVLDNLNLDRPITLLTTHYRGVLDKYVGKYRVVDLGWIDNIETTIDHYNAADMFLMPSTAEAFGMMAMEAMACGKPVIVFEGTALPEVVHAPEGGIAVPMGDTQALEEAVKKLIRDEDYRLTLGCAARKIAEQKYDINQHAQQILDVYQQL